MSARVLKVAIAALCACLLVELCVFGHLVHTATEEGAQAAAEASDEVSEVADDPVYDAPAEVEPPLYYQADERWGGLPYATADSDIAESGCGLCAAAMCAAYLTGKGFITPSYLLNLVGNRCIDGGMNHMGLFCQELSALYGFEYVDLWTLGDAEEYLRDDWCLFAGMSGSVYEGGREYGAHVLFIWKCDEDGVYVMDSADPSFQRPLTWDEFEAIQWGGYWYAIREGETT